MSVKEISANLNGEGLKVCLAVSRFNDFLTRQLLSGAKDCLLRHGVSEKDITVVWTPGANELPMAVRRFLQSSKTDAVAVLGAVIQGATPHADLINTQVARSLAGIAAESSVPVINGVVSAENLEQAIERCGTKSGNKGWQSAQAAIEMANLYRQFDGKGD
ncbi:MAG: 6,7-dimethyl-8-ribityllumazine synthase [Kiritimatiellia bacterium]